MCYLVLHGKGGLSRMSSGKWFETKRLWSVWRSSCRVSTPWRRRACLKSTKQNQFLVTADRYRYFSTNMTVIFVSSVPLAFCAQNKRIPYEQVTSVSVRLYPSAADDQPRNCRTELSFIFDKGEFHLNLSGNSKFGYNMREMMKILD